MTTGTVTLSLADVDKLRDEIKEGKRIEEELKQELAEEKANNVLKIANLQKESEKIVNKVQEENALVVEELQKEVGKWIKDYTDLKEDRDAKTEAEKLMDKIKELEKALEKETAKKWWNKLY